MKPLIGITSTKMFLPGNQTDEYAVVCQAYAEGIIKGGGIPFIIPPISAVDVAMADGTVDALSIIDVMDGLLLTGGEDITPHLYGENPHPNLGATNYERDIVEIAMVGRARKRRIPVFGVCRGMQLINVACGGTLYQDIPSQIEHAFQHAQVGSWKYGSHQVALSEGFVRDALGGSLEVLVNSMHHQAVKDVATGFRVTGVCSDGVIEAIESEDGLVFAVQWHPERMWEQDMTMQKLASAFVKNVQEYKRL